MRLGLEGKNVDSEEDKKIRCEERKWMWVMQPGREGWGTARAHGFRDY